MKISIHATPERLEGRSFLRIESKVEVHRLIDPSTGFTKSVTVDALWDTGATNTYIPMALAEALCIPLGEEVPVKRVRSNVRSRYCKFWLEFPEGIIRIEEGIAVPNMQTDLIIGMDVMSKGVTTIEPDGSGGVNFTFTL